MGFLDVALSVSVAKAACSSCLCPGIVCSSGKVAEYCDMVYRATPSLRAFCPHAGHYALESALQAVS